MSSFLATSQWVFFGTGDSVPTMGIFWGQLTDLGCTLRARSRVYKGGILVGIETVAPERSVFEVPIHLAIPGVQGEINLDVELASKKDIKRYRRLRPTDGPPASDVTVVGHLTAVDREEGRGYRNLVRPVLCVLGELFPAGVVQRSDDGQVFRTAGMRRRMQTDALDTCYIRGRWSFDEDVMPAVHDVIESNPNCRRVSVLSKSGLTFRQVPTLILRDAWDALYTDLELLCRHATGGRVSVTGPDGAARVYAATEEDV